MGVIIIDTLQRGGSGTSPFPVILEQDSSVSYVTVADSTARDAIPEWKRRSNMQCYVIADAKAYRLGTDLTIPGQVWTEIPGVGSGFQLLSEKGQADGYVPLNANAKVDPGYIDNIYSNNSFVAASEAAMLALATQTGDIVTRTDTSQIFVKLNNNAPPTVIGDFAELLFPGAVLSVNGQTGAVTITIGDLITADTATFNTAVGNAPVVTANAAAITVNQGDITTLQADVLALQNQGSTIDLFDTGTDYTAGESFVVYDAGTGVKELYRCIQSTINPSPLPTDPAYWEKIGDYYTKQEITNFLSVKADLVGGKVPTSQLPAEAFANLITVENIIERNSYTPLTEGLRFYVIDATADPDIDTGSAEYVYSPGASTADVNGFVLIDSAQISAKSYSWTWSQGISGGGDTYQDFVIIGADGGEIGGIPSSILFVAKTLQVSNFSIETTNVLDDTIRIAAASGDVDPGEEVALFYNRQGVDYSVDADVVSYNNLVSGLTATNVQDALDEIAATDINTDGMGTTFNGDKIDLGGGLTLTGSRQIEIAAGTGPANQLRINAATGSSIRKWLQFHQELASLFGNETNVGFAGSGVESGGLHNFPGTGPIAGFYSKTVGTAGTTFGAGIHANSQGELIIWPGANRSNMLAFKYLADYAGIDWATDLAGSGVYIPHQARVQELINAHINTFGTPVNKTISAGVLDIGTDRFIIVNAESGVTDQLDQITGTNIQFGEELLLLAATGDTITLSNATPAAAGGFQTAVDGLRDLPVRLAGDYGATPIKFIYTEETGLTYHYWQWTTNPVEGGAGKGATEWYVATTGDNTNEGSAGSPLLTVQEAIDQAAAGDIIYVAPGTYAESPFLSAKNLAIIGTGNPSNVLITGQFLLVTAGTKLFMQNIHINRFASGVDTEVTTVNVSFVQAGSGSFSNVGVANIYGGTFEYLYVNQGGPANIYNAQITQALVANGDTGNFYSCNITTLDTSTSGVANVYGGSVTTLTHNTSTTVTLYGITPGTINGTLASPAYGVAAESISYDNTTSGLAATDTQAAIDEVHGLIGPPEWGAKVTKTISSDILSIGTDRNITVNGEGGAGVPDFLDNMSGTGVVVGTAVRITPGGSHYITIRDNWSASSGDFATISGKPYTLWPGKEYQFIYNGNLWVMDGPRSAFPTFSTQITSTIQVSGELGVGIHRLVTVAANSGTADDANFLNAASNNTDLREGDLIGFIADTGDTITMKHNNGGANRSFMNFDNVDIVLDQEHPTFYVVKADGDLYQVNRPILNITITQSHKTYYVSNQDGSSGGDGTFLNPKATINQALTLRESDGSTYAEIVVLDAFTESGTLTLASNPTRTTKIRGTGVHSGSRITALEMTDTNLILEGIRSISTSLTQTSTNGCQLWLIDADAAGVVTSVADNTLLNTYMYGSSIFSAISGAYSLGYLSVITSGAKVILSSTGTHTFQDITFSAHGTMEINAGTISVVNLAYNYGGVLDNAGTLSITNFTHKGLVFTDTGTITVSGTETIQSGRFATPELLEATVSLTQAQIQALNTTPITVVAAQGANTIIEVHACTIVNNYNTAAFATATLIRLQDATAANVRFTSSGSFVQATAKRVEQMSPAAAVEIGVNEALVVSADANATAGNAASTFDVIVKYRIVSI